MFTELKKFVMADGVSGDEGNIADVIAAEIAPYVDEIKIGRASCRERVCLSV